MRATRAIDSTLLWMVRVLGLLVLAAVVALAAYVLSWLALVLVAVVAVAVGLYRRRAARVD